MGDLAQSGLDATQMALMMELMAAVTLEARPTIDAQAERRRAKDRDRKRAHNPRNSAESAEMPPPNEYISNPPPVSNETSSVSDLAERVVEAWNEAIPGSPLPQARKLNGDRVKHLRSRVKEHGEDAVFTAIRNLRASEFHSGISGKWTEGNLGWLLKSPENFQKMLERQSDAPAVNGTWQPPPTGLAALLDQGRRYRPRDQAA